MALESENTSNTSFPPQLLEPGSSSTERIPPSAWPVIGSTGTRRKNRTCLIASPPLPASAFEPPGLVALPPVLVGAEEEPNGVEAKADCPPGAVPAAACDAISTPLTSVSRAGG